jgi:hypothetical protein
MASDVPYFSLGLLSVLGAITLPILYFASYLARRVTAWSKREGPPRERVAFLLLVFSLGGFILGSFAQPLLDSALTCKNAGESLVSCLISTTDSGASNSPER